MAEEAKTRWFRHGFVTCPPGWFSHIIGLRAATMPSAVKIGSFRPMEARRFVLKARESLNKVSLSTGI
jgi:hypothetical protein